ncbi:MAG: hypothetical protein QOK43_1839 [Acidimicrobiaceae bacterium]|nr:hypothetical protein [Acidimicrobiaceae bacterium]
MNSVLVDSYLAAVAAIRTGAPRKLAGRAELEAEDRDAAADVSLAALAGHLIGASVNDPLRKQLHLAVAMWDSADAAEEWTGTTDPRTAERRDAIYAALDLDETTAGVFDEVFPVKTDAAVVISDSFEPWYTPERRARHEFYWPAYAKYLTDRNDWPVEAVASLDDATTKVVERLSDPERVEPYQSKGLVVGYVQSGKTANFTGVLAKAIDAGYRLLIVLTGTVNLLREQTQRRIDMELVGKENILRGIDPADEELMASVDYRDDPSWEADFVEHGILPSSHNYADIIRLTGHRYDYRSLRAGIVALEFERADKSKPLYSPVNLPSSSARIVVVKKNKSVLQKVVKDLKSISARLVEIPALIIDDESDQASINTSNPQRWQSDTPERAERTAINRLLAELLGLLPRSQYVGYTATPFANVFIDPSDAEDIFPKDFLVSLERPPGYMGVSDFHDLDPAVEGVEKTLANSKERAHVRGLYAQGADRVDEIREAIDAFVLSGAVKLYRERLGVGPFRHHTMLVHESVKVAEHAQLAAEIRDVWASGGYSGPAGLARMRSLFASDFLPVCHAVPDGPFATDFDELRPFIAKAVARITEYGGDPVIVVNGETDMAKEEVAFDKRSVWRILVGGTKLSRGYTVEGLTVSYYRRRTKQADTLMQMGRWFGFRRGYRDLVRLYIGRAEPEGTGTIDLYEAFEAIVRDEEAFRDQLRQYAVMVDGKPQITPAQIPPLVSQHLPWLRPSAPNKMFNAQLVVRRTAGSLVIPTGYPAEAAARAKNYDAMLPLLAAAAERRTLVVPAMANVGRGSFDAFIGVVPHDAFADALRSLVWITGDYYAPDIAFVREIGGQVDDWAVIVPQLEDSASSRTLPGVGPRSILRRGPKPPHYKLWGEPTDRKHRPAAQRVVDAWPAYDDQVVEGLRSDRRGAALLYPMCEKPEELLPEPGNTGAIVVGVAWITPAHVVGGIGRALQFKTRNKQEEKAAIVALDSD